MDADYETGFEIYTPEVYESKSTRCVMKTLGYAHTGLNFYEHPDGHRFAVGYSNKVTAEDKKAHEALLINHYLEAAKKEISGSNIQQYYLQECEVLAYDCKINIRYVSKYDKSVGITAIYNVEYGGVYFRACNLWSAASFDTVEEALGKSYLVTVKFINKYKALKSEVRCKRDMDE